MSTIISSVLNKHLNEQKPKPSHVEYLDKILWDIAPVYRETFLEIRNSIELTLLNNPKSENEVVSYLSWVSNKLNLINIKRGEYIKKEVDSIYS